MLENKISTLNEHGEKLAGIESIPDIKREVYPAVLLVHGFSATKKEGGMFNALAETLTEQGFLVYRFDFSGRGKSEGDYSETTLSKLSSDLSSMLYFVKEQDRVYDSGIGILAQSFGTSIVAALKPSVKTVVFIGSISHPKQVLSGLFGKNYNPEGISRRKRFTGIIVKPRFWKDFDNYDLTESIKEMNYPILFIHGINDKKVSLSEMLGFYTAANTPKEHLILWGAGHNLKPCRGQVYKTVKHWFMKYLL